MVGAVEILALAIEPETEAETAAREAQQRKHEALQRAVKFYTEAMGALPPGEYTLQRADRALIIVRVARSAVTVHCVE